MMEEFLSEVEAVNSWDADRHFRDKKLNTFKKEILPTLRYVV